jgi:hypothetical protein
MNLDNLEDPDMAADMMMSSRRAYEYDKFALEI